MCVGLRYSIVNPNEGWRCNDLGNIVPTFSLNFKRAYILGQYQTVEGENYKKDILQANERDKQNRNARNLFSRPQGQIECKGCTRKRSVSAANKFCFATYKFSEYYLIQCLDWKH